MLPSSLGLERPRGISRGEARLLAVKSSDLIIKGDVIEIKSTGRVKKQLKIEKIRDVQLELYYATIKVRKLIRGKKKHQIIVEFYDLPKFRRQYGVPFPVGKNEVMFLKKQPEGHFWITYVESNKFLSKSYFLIWLAAKWHNLISSLNDFIYKLLY